MQVGPTGSRDENDQGDEDADEDEIATLHPRRVISAVSVKCPKSSSSTPPWKPLQNMGNTESNVASGVKKQVDTSSLQIYNLVDLKGS